MAQSAPIGLLAVISMVLAFEFIFLSAVGCPTDFDTENGCELDATGTIEDPNNSSDSTFGFLEGLTGILSAVWDFVTLLFNLFTFNIPGAPLVVRFPISVFLTGGLVWNVVSLIRG